MAKILVVDDSALMRRRISQMLERRGWQVVTARNGQHALQMVESQQPDAITLDINMPEMDGLTFLACLMQQRPTPVVMVSSLTEGGALATLEALQLGAVDYVHKPDGTVSLSVEVVERQLCEKVAAALAARISPRRSMRLASAVASSSTTRPDTGPTPRPALRPTSRPKALPQRPSASHAQGISGSASDPERLVLVGASTGGPRALEDLLASLPAGLPAPVLICQHMPAAFTATFAQRLDQVSALRVSEVTGPTPLEPGAAYVGRGDADLALIRRGGRLMATAVPSDGRPWHPSVGRMVETAMAVFPADRMIGVMLTGMGDDGAAEMTALYHAGGRTIAEAEESCTVFGMPRALIALHGAESVMPARRIAQRVAHWLTSPFPARHAQGQG